MIEGKPYFDYKFLGVEPFTVALSKSGVSYESIEHSHSEKMKSDEKIFFSDEDVLAIGLCSKDGKDIYFADFGISIAPGIQTFVVFLYDHEPTFEDILSTSMEIESLTMEHLQASQKNSEKIN